MNIGGIDSALSTMNAYDTDSSVSSSSLAYAVGTAVLSESLDMNQEMGNSMVKMMEHSVTPELGGTIDIYA